MRRYGRAVYTNLKTNYLRQPDERIAHRQVADDFGRLGVVVEALLVRPVTGLEDAAEAYGAFVGLPVELVVRRSP